MAASSQLTAEPTDAHQLLLKSGAMMEGHFLLSSGLHSNRYFQCAVLLERPNLAEVVAASLADACRSLNVQTVLSPALGALLIGYELSRQLGCRNIFAERPDGKFELRRGFALQAGERVLLAENVITTGGSVLEVAEMAKRMGAEIVGYAAVVDRSAGRFAPAEPFFSYAHLSAEVYRAEDCPWCRSGSPLTKPGSRALPTAG